MEVEVLSLTDTLGEYMRRKAQVDDDDQTLIECF